MGYRNLTPNITKGQKRVKKGKKMVKIKNAIEIPFMSVIFGMYTQFIYVHMTIYRNLTPNICKGQKRVKKGPKLVKKMVKIKNAHRNTIYECIFGMFTQFINAHMTIYRNLTPNIIKGQQRVKNGSKMGPKF